MSAAVKVETSLSSFQRPPWNMLIFCSCVEAIASCLFVSFYCFHSSEDSGLPRVLLSVQLNLTSSSGRLNVIVLLSLSKKISNANMLQAPGLHLKGRNLDGMLLCRFGDSLLMATFAFPFVFISISLSSTAILKCEFAIQKHFKALNVVHLFIYPSICLSVHLSVHVYNTTQH